MRKIIGSLFLLFVIVILVSPAIVGQYVEYNIKHELKIASFPEGVSVKILDYQAGWFQSHAKIQLTFNSARFLQKYTHANTQQSTPTNAILFSITLNHGPLNYATNLEGEQHWFFGQAVVIGKTDNLPAPLAVYALLHFNNNLDIAYKLTKLNLVGKGEKKETQTHPMAGSINAIKGKITITDHLTQATGQTEINQINFLRGNLTVNISKITSNSSVHRTPQGYWTGQRSTNIPVIIIKSQQQDLLTLENINLHSQLNSDPKTQSMSILYNGSLQKISMPAMQHLGPLTLKFSVTGIKAKAFATLKQIAQSLKSEQSSSQNFEQQFLPFIQQYISALQGVQLHLSMLRLATPQGNIDISAKLTFPRQVTGKNQNSGVALALMLMNMTLNTRGQVNIQIPEKFVTTLMEQMTPTKDEIRKTIEQWKTVGILQEENSNLISHLIYQQGKVLINGESLQKVTKALNKLRAKEQTEKSTKSSVPESAPQQ